MKDLILFLTIALVVGAVYKIVAVIYRMIYIYRIKRNKRLIITKTMNEIIEYSKTFRRRNKCLFVVSISKARALINDIQNKYTDIISNNLIGSPLFSGMKDIDMLTRITSIIIELDSSITRFKKDKDNLYGFLALDINNAETDILNVLHGALWSK